MNNAQNQIASMNTSSGSGSVNLTYDADGNLTTDQTGQTYVYDAWNRVVSITTPGGDTVTYTYNALGERITETDGNTGVSTDLYYSNQKQVIEEQQSGTITAQYVWGPFYVNQLVQETTSSGTYYAEQDADWNVTSISNSSGAVVERYSYTPYGNVTVLNADGTVRGDGTMASSSVGQEVLGQGMRYSASTGTVDYRARIYVLSLGRFSQQDPTGFPDGLNRYSAFLSSPISHTDPSGLAAMGPVQQGALAGAGVGAVLGVAYYIVPVLAAGTPIGWGAVAGYLIIGAGIGYFGEQIFFGKWLQRIEDEQKQFQKNLQKYQQLKNQNQAPAAIGKATTPSTQPSTRPTAKPTTCPTTKPNTSPATKPKNTPATLPTTQPITLTADCPAHIQPPRPPDGYVKIKRNGQVYRLPYWQQPGQSPEVVVPRGNPLNP